MKRVFVKLQKEDCCIGLVALLQLHTKKRMKTNDKEAATFLRCCRLLKHPSPMSRERKKKSYMPHLQTTSFFTDWMVGGMGTLSERIEKKKKNKKKKIYKRTYNVLETTSTNTTSTSAWSLRNSWMQFITLTLPCFDPGRQGPEREEHTGWAADVVECPGL